MKYFRREKNDTVTASAGKLEVLIGLFRENLITHPERALRIEAPLFRAFHSFSNAEIEAAIAEAKLKGSDTAVLEASTYENAEAEAEALAAEEAAKPRSVSVAAAAVIEPEAVIETSPTPTGEAPQSGSNDPTN